MAKRKKTFIDRNGDTVRGIPSYLYMAGGIPYNVVCGAPTNIMDREYLPDEWEESEDRLADQKDLYLKWTGRVIWDVHVVYESDSWSILHSNPSAILAFQWMREFGVKNIIRIDERLHIPSDIIESDMMRENAIESMGPKFFVCGDGLDRRGEKYVRAEDDGIAF